MFNPPDVAPGTNGLALNGFLTLILPYVEQDNLRRIYNTDASDRKGYDHPDNQAAVNTKIPLFICPSTPETNRRWKVWNIFAPAQGGVKEPPGITAEPTDYFGIRNCRDVNHSRVGDGILRPTKTTFAQVIDGSSNTILVHEQAGKPTYYLKGGKNMGRTDDLAGAYDCFWYFPWAGDQGMACNLSQVNADFTITRPGPCALNCDNIYQPFSFHPGGVNVVFGDGSVRFLQEGIGPTTFFRLGCLNDGEVISENY